MVEGGGEPDEEVVDDGVLVPVGGGVGVEWVWGADGAVAEGDAAVAVPCGGFDGDGAEFCCRVLLCALLRAGLCALLYAGPGCVGGSFPEAGEVVGCCGRCGGKLVEGGDEPVEVWGGGWCWQRGRLAGCCSGRLLLLSMWRQYNTIGWL